MAGFYAHHFSVSTALFDCGAYLFSVSILCDQLYFQVENHCCNGRQTISKSSLSNIRSPVPRWICPVTGDINQNGHSTCLTLPAVATKDVNLTPVVTSLVGTQCLPETVWRRDDKLVGQATRCTTQLHKIRCRHSACHRW